MMLNLFGKSDTNIEFVCIDRIVRKISCDSPVSLTGSFKLFCVSLKLHKCHVNQSQCSETEVMGNPPLSATSLNKTLQIYC